MKILNNSVSNKQGHCHSSFTLYIVKVSLFYHMKFPDFSLISWDFPWFLLSFYQDILVKKTYLFFFNVASTYHWGTVYRNTNLLQIHFPKVKPPHIATPKAMYISTTFYLSAHCWKISLIWIFFPDFGWNPPTPFLPWFASFQNFPWLVGTMR